LKAATNFKDKKPDNASSFQNNRDFDQSSSKEHEKIEDLPANEIAKNIERMTRRKGKGKGSSPGLSNKKETLSSPETNVAG